MRDGDAEDEPFDALLQKVARAPAIRPAAILARGELVAGRFEIVRPVASGGMGRVYYALDTASGAHVALKTALRSDVTSKERFLREIRSLSELDHPRIVRYVGHGQLSTGDPFLAMEWIEGENLESLLERGPLDVVPSVTLIGDLADGLAVAHARDVVHRDIKPSNVFLEGASLTRARLGDFGMATVGTARAFDQRVTKTGEVVGTLSYMAPESIRGRGVVDARTDVFALGCLLFEALVGRPAFTGRDAAEVVRKILNEDPFDSVGRDDLPAPLVALANAMLSKAPRQRPSDAGVLRERVDAVLAHLDASR